MSKVYGSFRFAAIGGLSLALATCARNPVTGKNELSLVSESQEISMGRQAAQQAEQSIGLYDDPKIQAYVSDLGKGLAAQTERPNLPWEFHVVDDASVNAFALPGGFIFVTRGLMTHVRNEAELASVLGHEAGHVAARHSVQMISQQQLAQVGLVAGMILSPTIRKYGQAASAGLGLLFLKFSRDHEAQADELGFRYALKDRYDVRQMPNVFRTLDRVGEAAGGGKTPEWLQTHPNPGNRVKATEERIAQTPPSQLEGTKVNEDGYLQRIDGMVFGENPRQGFFQGTLFLHPDLKFQFQFPQGWKTQNTAEAVVAVSPQEDAIIQLAGAGKASPTEAAQAFFGQEGLQSSNVSQQSINGFPAVSGYFQAQTQEGTLQGVAAFLTYGGATYQLLGYTPADKFNGYRQALVSSVHSFNRLTDPRALNVQPRRVQLQRAPRAMTLEEFNRQFPSTISIEHLGIINELEPGSPIAAGQIIKRVVGQVPGGAAAGQ